MCKTIIDSIAHLKGEVTRDDSQRRFLAQTASHCWNNVLTIRNNVATMMQRFVALKVKCMEMYGSPCTHAKISKRLSKIRDFSSKNLKLATLLMFYAQSLNSLRSRYQSNYIREH